MSRLATHRKGNTQERSTTGTKPAMPASILGPKTTSPEPIITYGEITARAYALFLARGGQHGDDQGDWFRAEAELRREKGIEEVNTSGNV